MAICAIIKHIREGFPMSTNVQDRKHRNNVIDGNSQIAPVDAQKQDPYAAAKPAPAMGHVNSGFKKHPATGDSPEFSGDGSLNKDPIVNPVAQEEAQARSNPDLTLKPGQRLTATPKPSKAPRLERK